jgi:hypothetical protein
MDENKEKELDTLGIESVQESTARGKQSFAEYQAAQAEKHLESLLALKGLEGWEVIGYVWRLGSRRTSLPPISEVLADHEFGEMHGPGIFSVQYRLYETPGDHSKFRKKEVTYNIGPEYSQLHVDWCRANGRQCFVGIGTGAIPGMEQGKGQSGFDFREFLNKDTATTIATLLGALKLVFAPQNGGDDLKTIYQSQTELFKTMLTNGSRREQNPLQDRILTAAVERMLNPPQPADPVEMLGKQMQYLGTMKTMFGEESANPSMMEKITDRALDLLPALIEKMGAAKPQEGQGAKMLEGMESSIPKTLEGKKALYAACVRGYGRETADKLARSMGIDPASLQPQPVSNVLPAPQETPKPKEPELPPVITLGAS